MKRRRAPTGLLVFAVAFCLGGAVLWAGEESEKPLWSLQPVKAQTPPPVTNGAWAKSRLDRFILAELEKNGLQPSRPAEPAVLLRRVYFDLIGLPPSLEDISEFERGWAVDPDATLARTVDRLLASLDFGPRWGRHWLDVARYAESSGNSRNMAYVLAWRYRNWVIDALNRNTPFDQFVRQQIAGDLLPAQSQEERDRNLLGTGFLTVGVKSLGEQDLTQYELNLADDQIDAVSRGFLGLTVACARCHDHKFDPIPTQDYYALAGIFRSTAHLAGVETNNRKEEADGMPLGPNGRELVAAVKAHEEQIASMTKEYTDVAKKRNTMRDELVKSGIQPAVAMAKLDTMPPEVAVKLTTLSTLDKSVEDWKVRLKTAQDNSPPLPPLAMAAQEKPKPADSPRYLKGDVKSPREIVQRAALSAVPLTFPKVPPNESGRRQLAEWIANPENPLTSRVAVNRIWQHLFGRGLVETPDDFGRMGAPPTHLALLDDLAWRFVHDGWDVKALIRELVLSRTYRQSSSAARGLAGLEKDAENKLLWRMNRKPLEAEAVRDALLELGGSLDHAPLEGSQVATQAEKFTAQGRELGRKGLLNEVPDDPTQRSIYLPLVRAALNPAMQCFDVADPNLVVGQRRASIVPVQSLFLMNSDLALKQSAGLAASLLHERNDTLEERIERAWRRCLTRAPRPAEMAPLIQLLASNPEDAEAWAQVCQTLMMTGEFRLLE